LGEGHVALTFKVLERVGVNLLKLVRSAGKQAAGLGTFTDTNLNSLFEVLKRVHDASEIAEAAAKIQKPDQFIKLLEGTHVPERFPESFFFPLF
jgi:hypothetical protein